MCSIKEKLQIPLSNFFNEPHPHDDKLTMRFKTKEV